MSVFITDQPCDEMTEIYKIFLGNGLKYVKHLSEKNENPVTCLLLPRWQKRQVGRIKTHTTKTWQKTWRLTGQPAGKPPRLPLCAQIETIFANTQS